MIQALVDFNLDCAAVNRYGNTPAHIACLNGRAEALAILIGQAAAGLGGRDALEVANVKGEVQ